MRKSLLFFALAAAAHAATSVTQYGITWTFDADYTVGQYQGGDYYVVAPSGITISSVSPGWDGSRNGSMLDPIPLAAQGFDSRINSYYTYSGSNRVTFPLTLSSSSTPRSLVSCISLTDNVIGGAYQALSDMAVLTIVDSAPAAGSFRPAFVGGGTKTTWNTSQVNYGLVPTLAVPSGGTIPNQPTRMERIYPYFGPQVWTSTILPEDNVGGSDYVYPAYYNEEVSKIALAMFHTGTNRTLYINQFIQRGIDLYDISVSNLDGWQANGGFGCGMKWPIIFAGLLLNDNAMKNPPLWATNLGNGSNVYKHAEDGFTYIGASSLPRYGIDYVSMGLSLAGCTSNCMARDPDGVWNPEDNPNGFGGSYRFLTSNRWVGQTLAVHIMGATGLWNHDPYFDYIDSWVDTPAEWNDGSQSGWGQYHQDVYGYGDGSGYVRLMWTDYRDAYDNPNLTSATIPTGGTTLTMNLSESCTSGAGGSNGVTVSASGGAVTATYSSGSGSSAYVYTLSRTILQGETVTVSYTQPTNGIEATDDDADLATFSGAAVTNNSTQTANYAPARGSRSAAARGVGVN